MRGARRKGNASGNLPAEVTGFVGRSREIRQARKLLETSRLVTFVGVGGVGKTKLAIRIAREVNHVFSDGVWLVNLSDLPDTASNALIEQTIVAALGLNNLSAGRSRDVLIDQLRDRHCLLVLDNCEHLVEKVGDLVAHMLRVSERLHVLATSREVLGCVGEHVMRVPPLSLPSVDDSGQVGPGEALELLQQRAASVGYEIRTADLPNAVELCRQLDGLPLAIELAAGRLSALSLSQVVQRLGNRFELLIGGARDRPATHRTLRRVIEWSYQLCGERERLLWERISVFTNGFDLAAAEAVCAGAGIAVDDVLDLLDRLVRQSIVIVDNQGEQARYRLLETIRHYGLDQLRRRGAHAEFHARHAAYFNRRAREGARESFGSREQYWLEWARTELPNLRAAMDYGIGVTDSGIDIETAAQQSLKTAIYLAQLRIWFFLESPAEGRYWLEKILGRAPEDDHCLRVTAMALAGWISLCQGESDTAGEYLEKCQALAVSAGVVPPALTFFEGCYTLVVQHDPRGVTRLERELRALRETGEADSLIGMTELFWAIGACFFADQKTALRAARQHLDYVTQQGAARGITWGQWVMGLARLRQGDTQQALALARESLRHQLALGDRWGSAWGVHLVTWALAKELIEHEGDDRADTRESTRALAENVARLLGGAQRLREWTGAHLTGLGPFHDATAEAERAARRVLGEQAFLRAFEQGSYPGSDRRQAYQRILALAVDQVPTPRQPTPVLSAEPPAERLTAREHEVAALVARGWSNPQIARKLVISARTVQSHVSNILEKRGLRNRQEIAVWYVQQHPDAVQP